ncbi:Nucleolar protein 9 [Borealophlyctis nickersoniae]|nr:Nucleolar protein 9 [Borealophlyctis nickersoniae]
MAEVKRRGTRGGKKNKAKVAEDTAPDSHIPNGTVDDDSETGDNPVAVTTEEADTPPQQKRARGSRGGKSQKAKQARLDERVAAKSDNGDQAGEGAGGEHGGQEGVDGGAKKKTRRSRKGKTDISVNANAYTEDVDDEHGYGQEFDAGTGEADQGQGTYDQTRPSFARPEQPFFGMLPPDEHRYFHFVEKTLEEQEFESDEDRQLLVHNVFKEADGKELMVASDPDCSRILEKLLRASNDLQIRALTDRMSGNYPELFRHQFASHVCQTLLYLAAEIVEREIKGESATKSASSETDEAQTEPEVPTMEQLVLSICESLDGQWSALISDPYASHPVRSMLGVLSGEVVVADDAKLRSKKSKKYNDAHNNNFAQRPTKKPGPNGVPMKNLVPPSFTQMLEHITKAIAGTLSKTELRNLALHPVASPVLQLLLSYQSTSDTLVRAILNIGEGNISLTESDPFVESLIKHSVGSHLMEKIFAVARPELFHRLYVVYFRQHLLDLCRHPVANFVVQQLIANTKNATQVEVLFDELAEGIEKLLLSNRTGVVVKLVEASARHKAYQKEILKSLCVALHANTNEERKQLLNLILHLQPYEAYMSGTRRTPNLQGALIAALILTFDEEHSKLIVDSYMSTPTDTTYSYIFDPITSRVVEAILISPHVSLKIKRKILRNLQGKFVDMAKDKYGSHMVDKCWAVADLALKEEIAQELAAASTSLAQNFHGKFVLRNCKIEAFKQGRKEWVEREKGIERKRGMFSDLLGDEDASAGEKHAAGESDKDGGKQKKSRVEADPLWTTHKFDSGMAALGFAGVAPEKKSVKRKKGKNNRGADGDEDTAKMTLDEEDIAAPSTTQPGSDKPASQDHSKSSANEIDALFKGRKGDAGQAESDAEMSDAGKETVPETPKRSSKTKIDKDLGEVLEALSATKKKRKKDGAGADGNDEGNGKKRKFEG